MKFAFLMRDLAGGLKLGSAVALAWLAIASPARAQAPDIAACEIVTFDEAEQLIGGPLQVIEHARVKSEFGPETYDTICTYIPEDAKIDAGPGVSRTLDLTLHVLSSPGQAEDLLTRALFNYRRMANARNFPYAEASVFLVDDLGAGAFAMEAVTDTRSGYKTALIAFRKGNIGGTLAAWKKPDSSLELTKTALRAILVKLP